MKYFILVLLTFSLISCDDSGDDNSLLPNVPVNFTINLNLPEGTNLNFDGGQATFSQHGVRGVVVKRFSTTNIVAFDLACPHLELQACSTMSLENGLFMVCPCDGKRFQLTNGASEDGSVSQSARFYNASLNGNVITVSN